MHAIGNLARYALIFALLVTDVACGQGRIGEVVDAGGPGADGPLASCGDGIVNGAEACDVAISAGETGACPTSCTDNPDPCITTSLTGMACDTACVDSPVTAYVDGDQCCPSGGNSTIDDDCAVACGNAIVEAGETCDTGISGMAGECPTACDDTQVCTLDTLQNAGTCTAACDFAAITTPMDGDGCCPSGANSNNDNDCSASCGNSVVESGETCDIAIPMGSPGDCPTSCSDGMACTTDALLSGGTCNATCSFTPVTVPVDGDGCCPSGANANNDNDCAPVCGNSIVEPTEVCDLGIPSGPGSCPTMCNDGNVCTTDTLQNGGTCNALCSSVAITMPINADGCCPPGANANNDDDCSPVCGNMAVESGELCDTAIPSGPGSCPTMCDDGMVCTTDTLQNAGTCVAACSNVAITMPIDNDGCCPPGETSATDNDCAANCGNGTVDSGETCDTAIPSGPGSCPTMCDDGMDCTTDALQNGGTCMAACSNTPITTPIDGDGCCPPGETFSTDNDCPAVETAFRVRELFLRDPHVRVRVLFFCNDETNTLNNDTNALLQGDTNPADGILDLNMLMVFKPLAQSPPSTVMDVVVDADCTAPLSTTACSMTLAAQVYPTTAVNDPANPCLAPIPGTTSGYTPAVATPAAPCFVTEPAINFGLTVFGVTVPFTEAQFAATYNADPATMLTTGLFRAFLSEADADNITVNLPVVGNRQMSSLLPGGTGSCGGDDRDTGMAGSGWYFYMNLTADQVPWTP